jgi:hypothetical protein
VKPVDGALLSRVLARFQAIFQPGHVEV